MTFKDLKFKPHKVIPKKGIQATLEVKPQVFVSVIAGEGFYSSGKTGNRAAVTNPKLQMKIYQKKINNGKLQVGKVEKILIIS